MAHIPDGFLSAPVSAATLVGAGALVAYAARRAHRDLDDRAAPTLGLATAAIFAAQMVNFPIAAGTSGHLVGGVLLAALFGPWAACLVMTAVIIGQALLFADGGLTAIGANILNMGAAGALLGYGAYRLLTILTGATAWARSFSAAVAAYLATVLTGAMAGLEIGLSGVAPTQVSLRAMASVYAIIGVAEAAITGFVVYAIGQKRPDLLFRPPSAVSRGPTRAAALAALGIVAMVGGLISIVASAAPDGLERVALDLGFADAAVMWEGAPFAGYRAVLPGAAGTFVAVLIGVTLLFAGILAVGRAAGALARSRRRERS